MQWAPRSSSTRSRPGWGGRARCGPTSRPASCPDAMTLAKGLGGGLPIGALVIGERLKDVFAPGDHGSTFAGGPVVSAAAHAALDVIDDEEFLRGVREKGERLLEGAARAPGRLSARGRGLMVAAELADGAPEIAAPRAARAAPDHQRHRPDHAALPAAADRRRPSRSTTRSAACAARDGPSARRRAPDRRDLDSRQSPAAAIRQPPRSRRAASKA